MSQGKHAKTALRETADLHPKNLGEMSIDKGLQNWRQIIINTFEKEVKTNRRLLCN